MTNAQKTNKLFNDYLEQMSKVETKRKLNQMYAYLFGMINGWRLFDIIRCGKREKYIDMLDEVYDEWMEKENGKRIDEQ